MGDGQTLLELQSCDLELRRERQALDAMPEVAALAKKRAAWRKLEADALRLKGVRTDLMTELSDLDEKDRVVSESVQRATGQAASTDYREVQNVERSLSDLAKALEKVEHDRAVTSGKLEEVKKKEAYLKEYMARFADSVRADAEEIRSKAAGHQGRIAELNGRRSELRARIDPALVARYDAASSAFKGRAVEVLEGNTPSMCRMALQASSMSDLKHAGSIAECPYCHRILVLGDGGERA